MRILIDTNVWIWLQDNPGRIPGETLAALSSADNDRYLSVASCWEMAIKGSKLRLPLPIADYIPARLASSATALLPISLGHALHVGTLPAHHRDPFDRLLIAQALLDGLSVATADRAFALYGVDVLPA